MPRHSKRSKKVKHTRRRKTMRGGYYSAAGPLAVGAMEWKRGSEYGGFVADRGGNSFAKASPVPGGLQYGRGRSKGHKLTKKRRKMKGGGSFGAVSAGYVGPKGYQGTGPPDVVQQNTKGPVGHGVAKGGDFNDNGPKGGWSSFKGLFPK